MLMNRLKKLLFLHEDLFKGFTDKRQVIFIGILLVGIRDLWLNLFSFKHFDMYFKGKSSEELLQNIIVAAFAVILLGAADVLFYCIPLSDLFCFFRRHEKIRDPKSHSRKLMKVYILANMLVTPIDALSLYIGNNPGAVGREDFAGLLVFVLGMISLLWFFSTIIRGANTIYRLQHVYKLLTIPAAILWMELLGSALDFIYRQCIIAFFR